MRAESTSAREATDGPGDERLACAAFAGAFALVGSAVGQSGGGSYRFDPTAIASGGGTASGGSYALSGTFGQAAAATLVAAPYGVHDGLWCVGGYAPVYVAQEIHDNQFRIAGGARGLRVSWQVTGIRHDRYAEQNRIPLEEDKTGADRGKYLHPQAFGLGPEAGVAALKGSSVQTVNAPERADRAVQLPSPSP